MTKYHAQRGTVQQQSIQQSSVQQPTVLQSPIGQQLSLNPRTLAEQVFERYAQRAHQVEERRRRAELAMQQFGTAGRDPERIGVIAGLLANQPAWKPFLLLARLNNNWDQIVGALIGQHTTVDSYHDGVLVVRAQSPVWVTQLTYLIPQLQQKIQQELPGLPLDEVKVTGPGVQRRRGRYTGGRYDQQGTNRYGGAW